MAKRRGRFVGTGRPGRAAGLLVVAAFVASACGQIGGAHYVVPGRPVAEGAGDTGTAVNGPSFSGDPTAQQKAHHRKRIIITRITTTTTSPDTSPVPNLRLHVTISNTSGPLYACPVQGPFHVGDDFGAPRYTTNPPHPHAGNDIFAARGTPVVAPFDGVATIDSGGLGGNGVMVTGKDGFVYNAHLEAYGTLGAVHAGDVIGYVGNTGDAAGGPTHDHFEWHPYHPEINWVSPYGYRVVDSGSPPAVDPYPYLRAACS